MMRIKLNWRMLVLPLIATLLLTGCAQTVRVVPAQPLPPPKVSPPKVATDPVQVPTWLQ